MGGAAGWLACHLRSQAPLAEARTENTRLVSELAGVQSRLEEMREELVIRAAELENTRADLSEGKLFSISESTKKVVRDLDDIVNIMTRLDNAEITKDEARGAFELL